MQHGRSDILHVCSYNSGRNVRSGVYDVVFTEAEANCACKPMLVSRWSAWMKPNSHRN